MATYKDDLTTPEAIELLWQMLEEKAKGKLKVGYTNNLPERPPKGSVNVKVYDGFREEIIVPKEIAAGIFDAGKEVLAWVELDQAADIYYGESIEEAQNENPEWEEQTRELEKVGGIWRSVVPIALRYLRVKGAANITLRALYAPPKLIGKFSSDDAELLRIWETAAYTLQLCNHHFFIDGIKRDRLPWAGDFSVSLLANAYTFADAGTVRATLRVLGAMDIKKSAINGIADYTLWWIVCHDLYQEYWNDADFLRAEWPVVRGTIENELSLLDADGFLQESGGESWAIESDVRPACFLIDWTSGDKWTAEQALLVHALNAASRLARRVGDDSLAADLAQRSRQVAELLRERKFDSAAGLFDGGRHANMLAIIAGIVTAEEARVIAAELLRDEMPPVGTPYMAIYEVWAIAKAGFVQEAIERMRKIWGGMIKFGLTTFWEGDSPTPGDGALAFYGRPFGKSLCHAWGAGPAFLLPLLMNQPPATGKR